MWSSNVVNSVGLILDIVGAALLWKFGLPAEISRSGAVHLIAEQEDEAERAKAVRYDRISWWGFLALVLGFGLQLASNFIAPQPVVSGSAARGSNSIREPRMPEREFKWAFAQNADGTFLQNEFCRETLAESIYSPQSQTKLEREGESNVFVFRGMVESYKVYAFRTRSDCEVVLTGIKARQGPPLDRRTP